MSSNLYPAQNLSMNQSISSSSSTYFELENQVILRMPLIKAEDGTKKLHPSAIALREALSNKLKKISENPPDDQPSTDDIKDRLSIQLNTETRKGRIKFDDEIFEARLVDLPCIIESLKTTDKKMFYKSADICQMLVCRTQDDPWNSSDEDMLKNNKKENKTRKDSDKNSAMNKYKWPHGLAPPLKNVRRKRFRKVAKKKIVDYAEIEKEVKQIFRADRDAHKIDYEVLLVEGELDDENNDENKNSDRNNSLNNEDEFEDSSQEDIGATVDGNSCIDSAMDNESSKPSKTIKNKSSNLVEESNISFADEDSMMAAPTPQTKSKLPETDVEDGENTNLNTNNFDDCSMDNSNLLGQGSKTSNQRTGFKDLFVKDVLGDLSSSEDEEEVNDEDDDEENDEEEKQKKSNGEKVVKSFKFNLNKNSVHKPSEARTYTAGDDSLSNFEDSNIGYANATESDASNLDSSKFVALKDDENSPQINKTKNLDILDANSRNPDDMDNEMSLDANAVVKKPDGDFNFSDLSSSSDSTTDNKSNQNELNDKLNKLMEELKKIRSDREKRENEIKNIPNPALKAHLTSGLNKLIEEENRKQSEIDEIKSELND